MLVGSDFSEHFQQQGGQHRDNYKATTGSPQFQDCQGHFGYWNAVFRDVSEQLCPKLKIN
jgi:hypothetical protein